MARAPLFPRFFIPPPPPPSSFSSVLAHRGFIVFELDAPLFCFASRAIRGANCRSYAIAFCFLLLPPFLRESLHPTTEFHLSHPWRDVACVHFMPSSLRPREPERAESYLLLAPPLSSSRFCPVQYSRELVVPSSSRRETIGFYHLPLAIFRAIPSFAFHADFPTWRDSASLFYRQLFSTRKSERARAREREREGRRTREGERGKTKRRVLTPRWPSSMLVLLLRGVPRIVAVARVRRSFLIA